MEVVSPAKSPGLLSSLKKTFGRKSQDEGTSKSQDDGGASPYSPYSRTADNQPARTRPAVVPPLLTRPKVDYQQYRDSAVDSDYQDVGTATPPFGSSTSLRSYNTYGSTSDKSAAEVQALDFELGLMRQKWNDSKEDLRRERERAREQEEIFRREMEAREARYQRELEYARAGRSGGTEQTARGKRRN